MDFIAYFTNCALESSVSGFPVSCAYAVIAEQQHLPVAMRSSKLAHKGLGEVRFASSSIRGSRGNRFSLPFVLDSNRRAVPSALATAYHGVAR